MIREESILPPKVLTTRHQQMTDPHARRMVSGEEAAGLLREADDLPDRRVIAATAVERTENGINLVID